MQERIEIHKDMKRERTRQRPKLINTGSELYGACRHIPDFHRFPLRNLSTDEGEAPEKSLNPGCSISPLNQCKRVPMRMRLH